LTKSFYRLEQVNSRQLRRGSRPSGPEGRLPLYYCGVTDLRCQAANFAWSPPLRLIGSAFDAMFALLPAILFLPGRLLGERSKQT
jgi:hypothetical protein